MASTKSLPERFWRFVKKTEFCWYWTGAKARRGYGEISSGTSPRIMLRAHRVSWGLHHGAIPDGLWVLHSCDTPSCVRPDHLWVGTHKDNMRDMAAKHRGKQPHGTPLKLNEQLVRDIRAQRLQGLPQSKVASGMGVTRQTISLIDHKQLWGWVADN